MNYPCKDNSIFKIRSFRFAVYNALYILHYTLEIGIVLHTGNAITRSCAR